jgi:hypothetical protein
MEYPEEVIAISKKGKREVRALIDRGKFVRYEYLDPVTGEKTENKIKLVLLNEQGEQEEYFIIPLKQKNKFLLIRSETKPPRKIWDKKEQKAVELF